jgi:hypothetical protein
MNHQGQTTARKTPAVSALSPPRKGRALGGLAGEGTIVAAASGASKEYLGCRLGTSRPLGLLQAPSRRRRVRSARGAHHGRSALVIMRILSSRYGLSFLVVPFFFNVILRLIWAFCVTTCLTQTICVIISISTRPFRRLTRLPRRIPFPPHEAGWVFTTS